MRPKCYKLFIVYCNRSNFQRLSRAQEKALLGFADLTVQEKAELATVMRGLVLQREVGHVIRAGRAGRKGSDMPIRLLVALGEKVCRRPVFPSRKRPNWPRWCNLFASFASFVDQLRVVLLVTGIDQTLREVGESVKQVSGATIPFGRLEDNEDIKGYLDYISASLTDTVFRPRRAPAAEA